jgi:hypothetical protein
MRAGGGKAKGSQFERDICVALSLWVSNGKSEDLFWRSAMSGGRATVGARKGKDLARHAGDISATSREGHALTDDWYVECKRYADLNFAGFFLKRQGPLFKFWEEACAQAAEHGKMPMLIAREDRAETLVIVPTVVVVRSTAHLPSLSSPPAITVLRSFSNNADVLAFDDMVARSFGRTRLPPGARWLKPGEDPFSVTKSILRPRIRLTRKSKAKR